MKKGILMPKRKSFDSKDPAVLRLLRKVNTFKDLTSVEIKSLASILKMWQYNAGEIVCQEGHIGSAAYIVADGEFFLDIMDRGIKSFYKGDFFGEIALVDAQPRMGTIRAIKNPVLLSLEAEDINNEDLLSPKIAKKIYQAFARSISSYLREGSKLYGSMDVLMVQDGGCAPGYNPVTAFIAEYLCRAGRNVFIAAEGFKSVVSNLTSDYRCLVYDPDLYKQIEHIPGVIFSPPLRDARGADFRSERFPEFKYLKNQKAAAKNIINRNVKVIIGIGGNGTFYGIKALSELLPKNVQSFFVPVTVDSDVSGTDCIGEYTGVEIGSEKIRSYMADARTHKRTYIIEMMGARGGYHALRSCLGAGAHLAVLPNSNYNLKIIIKSMEKRKNMVIVVAEGYRVKERKRKGYKGNAAEYFRDELLKAGLKSEQRIICEGFSRDIRGAQPNNLDIMLAQRMARSLSQLVKKGKSKVMPAVLSEKEYSIPFNKIDTDNTVSPNLASLANRLTKK
jgi:6-phosphofructokinase 1